MIRKLPKPFDVDDMIATLLRLSGRQPGASEASRSPATSGAENDGGSRAQILDVARGLTTWGDSATYQRYLAYFVDRYRDSAERLKGFLASGNSAEAKSLLHQLRGSAGNLALFDVATLAGEIENAVLEGTVAPDSGPRLQNALEAAQAAILDYTGASASDSGTRPSDEEDGALLPVLKKLLAALDKDNPDAVLPLIDELDGRLSHGMLCALRERIDAFDFRGAERQLRALSKNLDAELKE